MDWILLQADLPYPQPQAGDVILSAGLRYELQPFAGEKVFRQTSPQMVRSGWKVQVHGWGKLKDGWQVKIIELN